MGVAALPTIKIPGLRSGNSCATSVHSNQMPPMQTEALTENAVAISRQMLATDDPLELETACLVVQNSFELIFRLLASVCLPQLWLW